MKHIFLAALLVTALSGCMDQTPAAPVDVPDDAGRQNVTVAPLALTLDEDVVVLRGTDMVTLTGTVSEGAVVAVTYERDLGGNAAVSNGTWTFSFSVPFGLTIAEVFADNGVNTTSLNATVKRNMALTVAIDHDPASGKADRSDSIFWDYGSMRSKTDDASYEGCAQPHPERPNAHDALLDYSDISGVPITYTPCGSFGVSVDDVDGVDYGPLGWCFTVNGEAAEFGISLLELEDGDVFTFKNCGGLF